MMHVYSPNHYHYRCLIARCATIGSTDRVKGVFGEIAGY